MKYNLPAKMLETLNKFDIVPERAQDSDAIAELVRQVFGPGIYAKTAEKIRENCQVLKDLSFVAYQGPYLIGSVRLWSFLPHFQKNKWLFLGPIVIDEAFQNLGIGKQLIDKVIRNAEKSEYEVILLIGDFRYFSSFGFQILKNFNLTYPVDPNRLLYRKL